MWHKLSFALLFAVLTSGQIASAQVPRRDICNDLKTQINFKWPEFMGVWYEHSRYTDLMEFGWKCVFRNYFNIKNRTCGIKVSGLSKSNQPFSSSATGTLNPGFLVVDFANGVRQFEQIYGTDFKSWAVIYSCQNIRDYSVEKVWILTRQRNPNPLTVAAAEAVLTQNNVSAIYLRDTMQNGCTN